MKQSGISHWSVRVTKYTCVLFIEKVKFVKHVDSLTLSIE